MCRRSIVAAWRPAGRAISSCRDLLGGQLRLGDVAQARPGNRPSAAARRRTTAAGTPAAAPPGPFRRAGRAGSALPPRGARRALPAGPGPAGRRRSSPAGGPWRVCSTIESAVASSRTSPSTPRHALQERIDLAGRVADHRVGQAGQQAEVARLAVELLQLPEVVLRLGRLLEQRREDQQHFLVQFAGHVAVAALPRLELLRAAGCSAAIPPIIL